VMYSCTTNTFIEQPIETEMYWAPTCLDRDLGCWSNEWVCLRCNREVSASDDSMYFPVTASNCPTHGPRSIKVVFNAAGYTRYWACAFYGGSTLETPSVWLGCPQYLCFEAARPPRRLHSGFIVVDDSDDAMSD
jgi:hypothetical protein